MGLFALHLMGFGLLSWRRKTLRFLPAMVTFTLLIALNLLKALEMGDEGLLTLLSTLAWLGLGFSVGSWVYRRRIAKG